MSERAASSKSADAYRTISEVAEDLGLPQHVLRFWETRFPQVKPLKRAGGRRFYRPEDVELLRAVKALLYGDGYTIKGVQRMLRDQGPKSITALAASSLSATRDRPEEVPTLVGNAAARSGGHDLPEFSVTDGPVFSPARLTLQADRLAASFDPSLSPAYQPAKNASGDVVGRLEAVLCDLVECERLIQQVTNL